jgi:hypothetical protein
MRRRRAEPVVLSARALTRDRHVTAQEPTTVAVAGDRFLVLANTFVVRIRADPATVAEPVVLSMPLAC